MVAEMLRFAQHDTGSFVTLSRSEGSVAWGVAMRRCAQHDRGSLAIIPYGPVCEEPVVVTGDVTACLRCILRQMNHPTSATGMR